MGRRVCCLVPIQTILVATAMVAHSSGTLLLIRGVGISKSESKQYVELYTKSDIFNLKFYELKINGDIFKFPSTEIQAGEYVLVSHYKMDTKAYFNRTISRDYKLNFDLSPNKKTNVILYRHNEIVDRFGTNKDNISLCHDICSFYSGWAHRYRCEANRVFRISEWKIRLFTETVCQQLYSSKICQHNYPLHSSCDESASSASNISDVQPPKNNSTLENTTLTSSTSENTTACNDAGLTTVNTTCLIKSENTTTVCNETSANNTVCPIRSENATVCNETSTATTCTNTPVCDEMDTSNGTSCNENYSSNTDVTTATNSACLNGSTDYGATDAGMNTGNVLCTNSTTGHLKNVTETANTLCPNGTEGNVAAVNETNGTNTPCETQTATSTVTSSLSTARTNVTCPTILTNEDVISIRTCDYDLRYCTVACKAGFAFPDGTLARTTMCDSSGNWSSPLPVCQDTACQSQPRIHGADITVVPSRHEFIIRCENGTRLRNGASSKRIDCSLVGTRHDVEDDCAYGRCSPLPLSLHAKPNSTIAIVGNVVSVSCIIGHLFPDKVTAKILTCNRDLTWKPQISHCQPYNCQPVPQVDNAVPNTTDHYLGSRVSYTCNHGYRFKDGSKTSPPIVCMISRSWSALTSPCEAVRCPSPPSVQHATREFNDSSYKSVVHYACALGFRFRDGTSQKTITCTEYGQWNETEIDCKIERCFPVPRAENVNPNTTDTDWGTVVTYTCNPGHRFQGGSHQSHITCANNSLWIGTLRHCIALNCSPLPGIRKALWSTTMEPSSFRYGSVFELRCQPGHVFPDNTSRKTVTCASAANGVKWTPFPSSCRAISCPKVPFVQFANASTFDHVFNSSVTFTCKPGWGFRSIGSRYTIRCSENATWGHYPRSCKPVLCPILPFWDHMKANTSERQFETSVQYNCTDGYAFSDKASEKSAHCSQTGNWRPPIYRCEEMVSIMEGVLQETEEARMASSIGTFAIITISGVILLLVLLDAKKIKDDIHTMLENISFLKLNKKRTRIAC